MERNITTTIQPTGILFVNPDYYESNEILFDHFYSKLKNVLEINLHKLKQFSIICSLRAIYLITFDRNRTQHMTFSSKKCKIRNNREIIEYMDFLRENLRLKMEMFCNSNDVNPYYTLREIENIKVSLFK